MACDSYTWNGKTYTESGRYDGTTTDCVTYVLVLTIIQSTENEISVTACDIYTWELNGETYTESGGYIYVTTNAEGCSHTIYLELTILDCGISGCETAFAKGNGNEICFLDDEDNNFNRWGWTNFFEEEGNYTLDLYAGAGQCETENGALVGNVAVDYDNGEVTVTYNLNNGYVMTEAHVYVGCDPYPTKRNGSATVAPGEYPFNPQGSLDNITNYTVGPINVSDVYGGIYVIAHAVTCSTAGDFDSNGSYSPSDNTVSCEEATSRNEDVSREKEKFVIYPVPFNKEVFVKYSFDYDTSVKVEIFNLAGALIRSYINSNYSKGKEGIIRIDLSETDDQMYIVKLTTAKDILVKKIVSSSPQRKN
jgi:hypothetical protein